MLLFVAYFVCRAEADTKAMNSLVDEAVPKLKKLGYLQPSEVKLPGEEIEYEQRMKAKLYDLARYFVCPDVSASSCDLIFSVFCLLFVVCFFFFSVCCSSMG